MQLFLRGETTNLESARDALQAETGARLFGGLRPVPAHLRLRFEQEGRTPDEWVYFEMTVGPGHLEVEDEVFREAWAFFFKAIAR